MLTCREGHSGALRGCTAWRVLTCCTITLLRRVEALTCSARLALQSGPAPPDSMKPSARSLRVYVAPVVELRSGARTGGAACAAKSSAAAPSQSER